MALGKGLADAEFLRGRSIAVVGRLCGLTRGELSDLARDSKGRMVEDLAAADLVVVAETADLVNRAVAHAGQNWPARVAEWMDEAELCRRLRLIEGDDRRRLYTASMLADLAGVPVAVVRKWRRRDLIQPAHVVRRLEYYDFQELAVARRLAEILASGVRPAQLDAALRTLQRLYPGVERPLAQLGVIVRDRDLLLRRGEGLIDRNGQFLLDFDDQDAQASTAAAATVLTMPSEPNAAYYLESAARFEDEGDFLAAVDAYREAALCTGPDADVSFRLAELHYLVGELPAARERYWMAVEIDPHYVEAYAGLGCVQAEMGRHDLAIEAFRRALKSHPDYLDMHYHLAQALERTGDAAAAREHWRRLLDQGEQTPWAREAATALARGGDS